MLIPLYEYQNSVMIGKRGMDAYSLFYLYGYGEIKQEDYAMTIADLAITSLETITAFGASDGKYLFTLDELQNATISQSQESTDITGKAGRKLSTLKRNKTFTISASNGLISTGLLEAQTGGTIGKGAHNVNWTETVSVVSGVATLTYKAVGTAGAEIKALYVKNEDGTLGDLLTQGVSGTGHTSPDLKEFFYVYDTSGTTPVSSLTFNAESGGAFENDGEAFVIYERKVDAKYLTVDDDISDVKANIYVDAIAEDKCAHQYHVQLHVPKADISAEFSIDMGDNQAIHSFEAQALAGKCGESGNFWEWTIFGVNASDYTTV